MATKKTKIRLRDATPDEIRRGNMRLIRRMKRLRGDQKDELNEKAYRLLDHCIVGCYVTLRRLEGAVEPD